MVQVTWTRNDEVEAIFKGRLDNGLDIFRYWSAKADLSTDVVTMQNPILVACERCLEPFNSDLSCEGMCLDCAKELGLDEE